MNSFNYFGGVKKNQGASTNLLLKKEDTKNFLNQIKLCYAQEIVKCIYQKQIKPQT